jgi:hypothetical protein
MFNKKWFVSIISVILITVILASCNSNDQSENTPSSTSLLKTRKPALSPGGERIVFDASDSALKVFEFAIAGYKNISITTTAPARIVVCTAAVSDGIRESVPVFESPELIQLYTDYAKAKQDLLRTTREVERLKDLLSHNAIAGKEVVAAENDKLNANATLAGIESRMLTVGLSPAELSRLDPDAAILIANVPESEISSVQLHEDAQIEFDSFKGSIMHGRVSDIGKAVDPLTRSFIVRISLRDKEHVLRPGMFARASFGEDISRRFVVPQGAIVTVQGKSYVFVTKDKHSFERKEITVSQQSKDDFVVTGGLSEGDIVVSSGALLLKALSFGS